MGSVRFTSASIGTYPLKPRGSSPARSGEGGHSVAGGQLELGLTTSPEKESQAGVLGRQRWHRCGRVPKTGQELRVTIMARALESFPVARVTRWLEVSAHSNATRSRPTSPWRSGVA